jgi:hypothetical protein
MDRIVEKVRGQRSDCRGENPRSEVRGQIAEVKSPIAEVRGQIAEVETSHFRCEDHHVQL